MRNVRLKLASTRLQRADSRVQRRVFPAQLLTLLLCSQHLGTIRFHAKCITELSAGIPRDSSKCLSAYLAILHYYFLKVLFLGRILFFLPYLRTRNRKFSTYRQRRHVWGQTEFPLTSSFNRIFSSSVLDSLSSSFAKRSMNSSTSSLVPLPACFCKALRKVECQDVFMHSPLLIHAFPDRFQATRC